MIVINSLIIFRQFLPRRLGIRSAKLLLGNTHLVLKNHPLQFFWSKNMKLQLITRSIWQYLNQRICDQQSIWSLRRFWYLYRIELLKKCWQQEYSHQSNHYP